MHTTVKPVRVTLALDIEDYPNGYEGIAAKFGAFAVMRKMDGVRGRATARGQLGRSNKPLPNINLQEALINLPTGAEYEVCVMRSPTEEAPIGETTSFVMSHMAPLPPLLRVSIFDVCPADAGLSSLESATFVQRRAYLETLALPKHATITIQATPMVTVTSGRTLQALCERLKEDGEGAIIRPCSLPYLYSRSGVRNPALVRAKRHRTYDARIIAVQQAFANTNEAFINERGLSQRSDTKDGKTPTGMVGSFTVLVPDMGTVDVGTFRGVDHATRAAWWDQREALLGRWIEFDALDHGIKDSPRHCTFIRFRDDK